jgi:uncharacterized protein (TIGR03435 family)
MTAAILRTGGMRTVLSVGLVLYAIYGAFAQSVTSPAFEVASIKPNTSGSDGGSIGRRGDAFAATNVPLTALLDYAYGPPGGSLLKEQIIGAPEWANTDRFEVQAKLPRDGVAATIERTKQMLQSLLQERFQLKAHRESRNLPVYNLVLIKKGPKLSMDQTPPDPRQRFIQFSSSRDQQATLPRGAMRLITEASGVTLSGTAIPVSQVVSLLQGRSDRMIFDKTDFSGLFDIHLEFSPTATTSVTAESDVSLFTAIQEIGLKLESAKAPVEVLVIDSVLKPSVN